MIPQPDASDSHAPSAPPDGAGASLPPRRAPTLRDASRRSEPDERIADEIVRRLAPRRVFVSGCGPGRLVEALWDRGVETHGRDAAPDAIAQVRADVRRHCAVAPAAAPIAGAYDLVVSLDTPPPAAMGAMARAAPRILHAPTSAPAGGEAPARAPEEWLRDFAAAGFAPRPAFDASFLGPQAMLLERAEAGREPAELAVAAEMARLRMALAAARQAADSLEQALAQADAARMDSEARLRQATRQNELILQQAAAVERHRDALLASTSWRITRPLRLATTSWPARAASRALRIAGLRSLRARIGEAAGGPALAAPAAAPDAVRSTRPPAIRAAAVDIVVCVHNALPDVERCLASVLAATMPPYRLIVVDDGSGPETAAAMAKFARIHRATLIRHDVAKGYTLAANVGLRASRADWVVLLNSDTIVTEGWLDRMVELGERDPRHGLIGPLSNTASWQSVPRIDEDGDWAENRLPEGLDIAAMARLVAGASARQGVPFPFLNGFCLMLRRSVIEDVGLFDEATFGAGYGEENDYCIRARKRGWKLMVADDAYVFHAQSRSYSSDRRLQLARRADEALARKHTHETDIMPQVLQCRDGLGPIGARTRVAAAIERARLAEAGRAKWEGGRVAFVLPISEAGGGANVVIQEARAMRRMGVDVWFVNLSDHRGGFELGYPEFDFPVLWAGHADAVAPLLEGFAPRFDAIVATAWKSAFWLPPDGAARRLAYYVQDFEPLFYAPGTADHRGATQSYLHRPALRMFTKTRWNADLVAGLGVPAPDVIGASVDLDLFRPAPEPPADARRAVRVCAMLRPGTPRRAAGRTLETLRALERRFGARVALTVFGCTDAEAAAAGLALEGIVNLGMLRTTQVAALMEATDVFLDLSHWQAMGLTALEAMAAGCAVVAPRRGGAAVFARDNETALLCDTDDADACREAAERLVADDTLRAHLRRAALAEAARHPPEAAAFAMLNVLLGQP